MGMAGGNSHHACAESHIDHLVLDDGGFDRPVDPFNCQFVTIFPFLISFVERMHHYILIAKFRFWPRGTYFKWSIFKSIELIFLFFVDDLIVGDNCLAFWVPIYNPMPAIDEPIIVHLLEGGFNREVASFVQGE